MGRLQIFAAALYRPSSLVAIAVCGLASAVCLIVESQEQHHDALPLKWIANGANILVHLSGYCVIALMYFASKGGSACVIQVNARCAAIGSWVFAVYLIGYLILIGDSPRDPVKSPLFEMRWVHVGTVGVGLVALSLLAPASRRET